MSFKNFNFDEKINAGIKACGYNDPTPIQTKAIPEVIKGRDIMGLAQTGTGKTAAFVLPMLQRLMTGPRRKPRAVIVAPTRELAEQINENIRELGRQTGLRSVVVYGGVGKGGQLQMFRSGVEIIVACPGRLLDHLDSKALRLDSVEMLVLDEADMMFDMGFMPAIKRLIKYMPKSRQNLLFSATMPPAIRSLANQILVDPVTIQVDHSKPADTVSHVLIRVEQKGKTTLLKSLMKETNMETTLVFTRTKYKAKNLAVTLQKAGHQAVALQGNMSQNKRKEAMDGFRQGKYNVLVATDIAARGIDVSGISHVINFDVPDTVEAYTHRIGRTGRAQCNGEAITFAGGEDLGFIKQVENRLNSKMVNRENKSAGASTSANQARHNAGKSSPGGQGQGRKSTGGNSRRPNQKAANSRGKSVTAPPTNATERKTNNNNKQSGRPASDARPNKPRRGRRSAPLGVDFLPRARRRGQNSSARSRTES
ncbi:MAG: DEAD/DEAH box helicase [Thermodesulfobacteriota bacterium]